jgi:hypothetical protein
VGLGLGGGGEAILRMSSFSDINGRTKPKTLLLHCSTKLKTMQIDTSFSLSNKNFSVPFLFSNIRPQMKTAYRNRHQLEFNCFL